MPDLREREFEGVQAMKQLARNLRWFVCLLLPSYLLAVCFIMGPCTADKPRELTMAALAWCVAAGMFVVLVLYVWAWADDEDGREQRRAARWVAKWNRDLELNQVKSNASSNPYAAPLTMALLCCAAVAGCSSDEMIPPRHTCNCRSTGQCECDVGKGLGCRCYEFGRCSCCKRIDEIDPWKGGVR